MQPPSPPPPPAAMQQPPPLLPVVQPLLDLQIHSSDTHGAGEGRHESDGVLAGAKTNALSKDQLIEQLRCELAKRLNEMLSQVFRKGQIEFLENRLAVGQDGYEYLRHELPNTIIQNNYTTTGGTSISTWYPAGYLGFDVSETEVPSQSCPDVCSQAMKTALCNHSFHLPVSDVVAPACKVFSKSMENAMSMSSAIRLLIACDLLPREDETTAWFVELVNDWFDLMTSRRPCNDHSYATTHSDDPSLLTIIQSRGGLKHPSKRMHDYHPSLYELMQKSVSALLKPDDPIGQVMVTLDRQIEWLPVCHRISRRVVKRLAMLRLHMLVNRTSAGSVEVQHDNKSAKKATSIG
ncbi:hypothetical protein ABVT39_021404 [Epinephelus coioides]